MLYLNEKREKQRENNLKIFSDYYSPKLTDKENFDIMKIKGLTAKSLQTFKKYKEQLEFTNKRQKQQPNKCDISADNEQMEQSTTDTAKGAKTQSNARTNVTNDHLKTAYNNKENNMNMATYNKQMELSPTNTAKGAHGKNKSENNGTYTANTYALYPFYYPLKKKVEMLNLPLIVRYKRMVQNVRYMAV